MNGMDTYGVSLTRASLLLLLLLKKKTIVPRFADGIFMLPCFGS
jgi:hypothetical protein